MRTQGLRYLAANPIIVLMLCLYGCGVNQKGDIDETTFIALDVGIVSALTSGASMHPVQLSETLLERHANYEGLEFDSRTMRTAIKPSLLDGEMNGVLIDAKDKGMLISKVRGSVSTTIFVMRGEFGIVEGDLYFSEGTQIDTDGDDYIFRDGQWQIIPPPVTVEAVVVSVDAIRLDMFGLKPDSLGPVLDDARNVFSTAKPAAWPDLLKEAGELEVVRLDDSIVRLGDIAMVELRRVELSAESDELTFILAQNE